MWPVIVQEMGERISTWVLAAALPLTVLVLTVRSKVHVSESRRLQVVLNYTRSHEDCLCNFLASSSTKPIVLKCVSGILRSVAFVKMSLMLSAVGTLVITKLLAVTMSRNT